MRLAAFLRGINVGGHHTVRMAELVPRLEALGLTQVKTLLNSGNVVFEAGRSKPLTLESKVSTMLEAWLGFEVAVMVRTVAELEATLAQRPTLPPEVKCYVAFLNDTPTRVTLPLLNAKEGFEVYDLVGRDALLKSLPVKGRYGYSMSFLELATHADATARNWNTVAKTLEAAKQA